MTDEQAKKETGAALPPADGETSVHTEQQNYADPHVVSAVPKNHARRSTPWLLWLVVIALCGALGAFYWQQTRFSLSQSASLQTVQDDNQQLSAALSTARASMQAELQEQVSLMQASAVSLEQALSELQTMEQQDEQRIQSLQQRIERQLQDTRTLVTALQRQVAGLQQRDTRWVNAEAAYLMRLAEHKLVLEKNPQAALQLLRSVDVLLRDQLDPLAQTAQQNLAQDISAIQTVHIPDRFALAQRVTELASVLDNVSVTGARQAAYQQGIGRANEQTPVVAQDQSWTAAVMNLFRSIFVWRQADQNPLEFLPPDQEGLIKLQLRLQFEQARLAVIQADQRLFEDSLEQVAAGLQRYFMQESEVATQLHDDVQALATQSIQADLPDISATRALVEQLQGADPELQPQPVPASSGAPQTEQATPVETVEPPASAQPSSEQQETDQ
ncbi:MAG: uroporphyrinogen-III C-methyltransferase [Pseudohongiella sp.]|nr:uroporphyrinogen-III C-methyltransferase [Pseudohongiella sp.]